MGQSDWTRIELSQILLWCRSKIPAFPRDWKRLSSFFRPWSILSETVGDILFQKELPLMIEYGEVKSKLGSELEIYAEKHGEDFPSSGPQGHECDTNPWSLSLWLLWLSYFTQPCCCRFIKIWRFIYEKIKTYKVKAFTLIEMLVVLLIISVLLLLFVLNLTKQKTLWKRQVMQLLSRWSKARLNCMNSIIPMTKPL